jgi:photosystem II stability/assembly factor-like uncharacterized protein
VALPVSRAEAVHFIDAQHGWVLQDAADDRGARIVLATDDGGATWRQLARLQYELNRLDFVDAMHGWAAGDDTTLLATADGGASWSVVREAADQVRGIDLVTPETGWLVSTAGLMKTNDGGATWTEIISPCPGDDPHGRMFVGFASATDGLLACTTGGGAGFEGKALYATRDGGATWDEIPDALGSAGYLAAIGDAGDGFAWCATAQPGVALFLSHDGGATWSFAPDREPGEPARSLLGPASPSITGIRSAQFIDAMHGWLVVTTGADSGPGSMLATSDGGETWTPVPVP